ncbi:putative immunoglobulin-like domain containing protein [Namao virus]|nr:putative immunoglobulin-like domain containing protein [Namao virus]
MFKFIITICTIVGTLRCDIYFNTDITADVGDTIKLICNNQTSSSIQTDITWSFNNTALCVYSTTRSVSSFRSKEKNCLNDRRYHLEIGYNNYLQILNVNVKDTGEYICVIPKIINGTISYDLHNTKLTVLQCITCKRYGNIIVVSNDFNNDNIRNITIELLRKFNMSRVKVGLYHYSKNQTKYINRNLSYFNTSGNMISSVKNHKVTITNLTIISTQEMFLQSDLSMAKICIFIYDNGSINDRLCGFDVEIFIIKISINNTMWQSSSRFYVFYTVNNNSLISQIANDICEVMNIFGPQSGLSTGKKWGIAILVIMVLILILVILWWRINNHHGIKISQYIRSNIIKHLTSLNCNKGGGGYLHLELYYCICSWL